MRKSQQQQQQQQVRIEVRCLSARTQRDVLLRRVVKPLGVADHWVSYAGSVVPVSRRSNGVW